MLHYSSRRDVLNDIKNGKLTAEAGIRLLGELQEDILKPDASRKKEAILEQTIEYIKSLTAEELRIPKERIKPKHNMEDYGIDSVMVVSLTRRLENDFGELSKTIFFECQTLQEVAEYFVEHYFERLIELFGTNLTKTEPSSEGEVLSESVEEIIEEHSEELLATDPGACNQEDDIAIVGVSGRYPLANDLDEFWENLKQGKDCITEIPKERWDALKYYDKELGKEGKTRSKWGGFIDDVDKFDPLFFNLSPKEAEFMDPQERLFVETAWHSFEDAGYTREQLSQKTVGVFAGVMYGEYQLYGAEETAKGNTLALSSSYAAIANRVSYLFNLHGPSITIDTMCSSSLTSIHLACESIKRGECNVAIAGGVNVSIHPNKYLILGQCNFASSDGRCRSFGKDGDGYVPGEGVGAVVLKSLKDAKKDHDRIYAVIKGSFINHGGKTNGYTVPNPKAQAIVISETLRRARVNPRTISYLEAHGTGTSLGDPIEITGLVKAYDPYTNDKNYCSIGSVKSNIGHLESAAGIAAVTKVLLQMKYKKLVPSIHSEELNPNINFANTPFRVQHAYETWERPVLIEDGKQVTYPRRAGISAFGAGGSNAHLIIEEYVNPSQLELHEEEYFLPISARNEKQLKESASNLLKYLTRHDSIMIGDIAYTLQTGREAMSKRLVILARTREQAIERLREWVKENKESELIYYGSMQETADSVKEESIERAWNNRELSTVARLWVQGVDLEFSSYYKEKRQIITLPGYPYARERYWFPEGKKTNTANSHISEFIDSNESTLEEQCYRKTILGNEFYVANHLVNGNKVVPGAVFIEMIQEAGRLALRNFDVLRIENVVFEHMLKVSDQPIELLIQLIPEKKRIACKIINGNLDTEFCYCHADIIYGYQEETVQVEYTAIKMETTDFSKEEYYQTMKKAGFTYLDPFRVVENVLVKEKQVCAVLHCDDEYEQMIFHPMILDGAFQATSFLLENQMEEGTLYVPYSVGVITSYAPLERNCMCVVREMKKLTEDRISFQIDLFNQQHRKIAFIKDYIVKKVETELYNQNNNTEILYATTEWIKQEPPQISAATDKKTLVFCNDRSLEAVLRSHHPETMKVVRAGSSYVNEEDCYTINPFSEENFKQLFQSLQESHFFYERILYAWKEGELGSIDAAGKKQGLESGTSIFLLFKSVLSQRISNSIEWMQVFYDNGENATPEDLAVISMAQTAAQENPQFKVKSLYIEEECSYNELNKRIQAEFMNNDGVVRYEKSRFVKKAKVLEVNQSIQPKSIFAKDFVVLITGGLGELGYFIAQKAAKENSVLILCGRSKLDEKRRKRLAQLEKLGAKKVQYLTLDGMELSKVKEAIDDIYQTYGKLDVVLHCAGVLRDSLIVKKSLEHFQEVLASKMLWIKNLERAIKDRAVKHTILFSSVSSLAGNVGQADYAYANAFMDAYANQRDHRQGKRMQSINWPLWRNGGMLPDVNSIAWMKENLGLDLLEEQTGANALSLACAGNESQFIVLPGEREKILQFIGSVEESVEEEIKETDFVPQKEELFERAAAYLGSLISGELHLKEEKIELDSSFEQYGIDSIMIVGLLRKLEAAFGKLPKTLFFECQNLRQLTQYFIKKYSAKIKEKLGYSENPTVSQEVQTSVKKEKKALPEVAKRFLGNRGDEEPADIAIIGLSGQYPMADDVEQFFQNLMEGKDCITEIPKERWNKSQNYSSEKGVRGKTYSKWGGFLDHIDEFDPLFFHISPVEAQITDPQERLFLQNVWHTMEDAGYTRDKLSKYKTGVYVGVMYGHYQMYGVEESMRGNVLAVGSNFSSIANRVSYFLNLNGPSMAIDTMCSSSLTSIHLACESIRHGECDMAFAGGVNLSLHPNKYILLSQSKFMSTDGRCRSFGEGGDGYVPGEGVGSILLKSLDRAIEDGDYIYGVVKATALNHGGKTNGYTVPNPNAQTEVIKEALRKAQIHPEEISYMEAHGTGTALGDPIEILGMANAFEGADFKKMHCSVGSVKSNIGHLESAAGIAAVTKVLLQMKHRMLVPSIHSATLNPNIDLSNTPFTIQQSLEAWEQPKVERNGIYQKVPRCAGISSFGAGGSNAHVIIQEWEETKKELKRKEEYLFVLSAQNEDRLKEYAKKVQAYLESFCQKKSVVEECTICDAKEAILQQLVEHVAKLQDMEPEQIELGISILEMGLDTYQLQMFFEELQERYQVKMEAEMEHFSMTQLADMISQNRRIQPKQVTAEIVQEDVAEDFDLDTFVYTYQVGREVMDERLACVIHNVPELMEKLNQYINGVKAEQLYHGNVRTNRERVSLILDSGEIGKRFMQELVMQGNLKEIANFWCSGIEIDFKRFYESEKQVAVLLPDYPFAKEHYWVPEPIEGKLTETSVENGVVVPSGSLQQYYLERIWNPISQENQKLIEVEGMTLILANQKNRSLAQQIATDLACPCIISTVKQCSDLIANKMIGRIIDVSDCCDSLSENTGEYLEKVQIIQRLLKTNRKLIMRHFTNLTNAFDVKEIGLNGTIFAGFMKNLSAEYRQADFLTVDLDEFDLMKAKKDISLVSNIKLPYGECCIRTHEIYVPMFREALRHKNDFSMERAKDKTWIVTGGTRGIGAEIAKWLVEQGVHKLALIGNSILPEESEWNTILKNNPQSMHAEKICFLQDLRKKGAKVVVSNDGVNDQVKLARFIQKVRNEMGPIGGVVHCAGICINNNPAFISKEAEDIHKVMLPKTEGVKNLVETLDLDEIETFITFSSISSVVPKLSVGINDYAAANSFMNTFADYMRIKKSIAVTSIIWPNWSETGMGTKVGNINNQMGIEPYTTKDGLKAFQTILERTNQSVILPIIAYDNVFQPRKLTLLEQEVNRKTMPRKDVKQLKKEIPSFVTKVVVSKEVGKQSVSKDTVEDWLRKIFSKELNIEKQRLDSNRNFGDYGVDSILIAELVKTIEKEMECKLEPSVLLEYPTLSELSDYFLENQKEYFQKAFQGTELSITGEDARDVETITEEQVMQNFEVQGVTAIEDTVEDEVEDETENSVTALGTPAAATGKSVESSAKKIAVIGMACNFPKSPNTQVFWENLVNGVDCITDVPEERWDVKRFYSEEHVTGKTYSKRGGFIKGIEEFDPEYFNIDPALAPHIDPLIRLALEISVDTMNDAGYSKDDIWGKKVGVYIGSRMGQYAHRIEKPVKASITGSGQNFIAAHISHFYNLKGPSVVVDSACSSSLSVLHMACQEMKDGDISMALVGGVDLLLDENTYIVLSESEAISQDGVCYAFDERANGFVPAEGCGAVLLKCVDDAIRDGDRIYAIIDSTAINNDGHTMGITTPNPVAQQEVIQEAIRRSGYLQEEISYVEAHGTGTMIGDPIELKGLNAVFRKGTDKLGYCAIGSVKSNLGHMLSAAGMGGLIKVILALQHKMLVPTIHCEKPNQRFNFAASPFYPNTKATYWKEINHKRVAGISSFGFGGTNAHVIVSEYHDDEDRTVRESLPSAVYHKKRYWFDKKYELSEEMTSIDTMDLRSCQSSQKARKMLEIIDETHELGKTDVRNKTSEREKAKKNMQGLICIIDET